MFCGCGDHRAKLADHNGLLVSRHSSHTRPVGIVSVQSLASVVASLTRHGSLVALEGLLGLSFALYPF